MSASFRILCLVSLLGGSVGLRTSKAAGTLAQLSNDFIQEYNQLTSDTDTILKLQEPLSEGVAGVARNQHQISRNIDKMITDFEHRFKEPEKELKLLEEMESRVTDIGKSLKTINENVIKVTKTIQRNHEVSGRAQQYIHQAEAKVKGLKQEVENGQEKVAKAEAAISRTKAEIRRKMEDVYEARRALAKRRAEMEILGILTVGLALPFLVQNVHTASNALDSQCELLVQRERSFQQHQENLASLRDELQAHSTYMSALEGKMSQLKSAGLQLSSNRNDLNRYREFLVGLDKSFAEVNICVQIVKNGLQKVVGIKNAANGDDFTLHSAIMDMLTKAYSRFKSSWIEAKEKPALKTALSFSADASSSTILVAIKGRSKRELPSPFEMAPAP